MKKLFVFLSVACMFAACTQDDATNGVAGESKIISSQVDRISYNEALLNAKNATDLMEDGQSRSIDLSNGVKAILNGNDTLMYVFNYKDNKGYAIVSASKKAPDFKIISEVGNLDPTSDKDSACTNYTRRFFLNKVIAPMTRGTIKNTTYVETNSTNRYAFETTTTVNALKSLNDKKYIYDKYQINPGYCVVTKTNKTQAEIKKAIDTSNNYALLFKYNGANAFVTEYTKIHTIQYRETKNSKTGKWDRVEKCIEYDDFSFRYQINGKNQYINLYGSGMSDFKQVRMSDREIVSYTHITRECGPGDTWFKFDVYIAPTAKRPRVVVRDRKSVV